MSKKESIIRDTTYYLPGNFVGQAVSFIRGIVVRRLLGPMSYGWMNIFTLIQRYAGYTDLGIINAMDREVPIARGGMDEKRERDIENNAFTAILASSLLVGGALFVYGLFSEKKFFPDFGLTLTVFALLLVLYRLSTFFSVFLRTHKKFRILSQLNVLRGILALVFIVFLAKKYGLIGVFSAEIISLFVFLILGMVRFFHPFSLCFSFIHIRRLISAGFPLLLLSLVALTIRNLDRFMIVAMLKDPMLLGYYSVGMLFSSTIIQIPESISVILFPRLLEEFGSGSDMDRLGRYVEEPTIIISYIIGVIIALVIIIGPFFLKYVLPQYQPGLYALRILCIGTYFMSLVNMSTHFLITIKKQHYLLGIGGGVIVLGILLGAAFIKSDMGITGIALSVSVVYFVYNSIVICCTFRHLHRNWRDIVLVFLKIYFPFFYFTACVIALHKLGRFSGIWIKDIAITGGRMGVLILLAIPFLVYLERRYTLFKSLKSTIWQR